ncbi:MAG: molecular chaperone DnaK, partial [Opitutaceae bacterium]
TLKDTGDKLPADKKTAIEAALVDAKKDLESNDGERMKAAMEKLSKVGAELYAEAQAAAQAAGAGAGAGAGADAGTADAGADATPPTGGATKKTEKKANVVDADFEVVDEDKNKK